MPKKPQPRIRVPLNPEQHATLNDLLKDVPVRKVEQYDWTSQPGRAFIKALRTVQVNGVPLPWIADTLDVSQAALKHAIGYWERGNTSSGRHHGRRIPLDKGKRNR